MKRDSRLICPQFEILSRRECRVVPVKYRAESQAQSYPMHCAFAVMENYFASIATAQLALRLLAASTVVCSGHKENIINIQRRIHRGEARITKLEDLMSQNADTCSDSVPIENIAIASYRISELNAKYMKPLWEGEFKHNRGALKYTTEYEEMASLLRFHGYQNESPSFTIVQKNRLQNPQMHSQKLSKVKPLDQRFSSYGPRTTCGPSKKTEEKIKFKRIAYHIIPENLRVCASTRFRAQESLSALQQKGKRQTKEVVAYSYTQPFLFPYLALAASVRRQGQKNALALTSLVYAYLLTILPAYQRIPNLTGPVASMTSRCSEIRNKTAGRIDGCHGDCTSCCLCYASKILRNFRTSISFKEKIA
ncbi:hypothetical protein ANN_26635 [Periplaneta americana]|uniref:Uncharacterized protein n=1 Tax=Periplaneta americana TaxID=6978 RepID=A0ABQ8RYL1_PERAM|nr:hypothetical protein ANN_26635 [Periplaneta americana]